MDELRRYRWKYLDGPHRRGSGAGRRSSLAAAIGNPDARTPTALGQSGSGSTGRPRLGPCDAFGEASGSSRDGIGMPRDARIGGLCRRIDRLACRRA
jgi:hypothetical protein